MTEELVGNGASPLLQVARFIEKPSPEEAKRMLRLGGFWSTMVVAARARTLWELGWRVLPEMMQQFDNLRGVLHAIRTGLVDREQEQIAIDHVYERIGSASFSTDVLQRAADSTLVFPMQDVQWSDWGRAKRVRRRSGNSVCARRRRWRRWRRRSDEFEEATASRVARRWCGVSFAIVG